MIRFWELFSIGVLDQLADLDAPGLIIMALVVVLVLFGPLIAFAIVALSRGSKFNARTGMALATFYGILIVFIGISYMTGGAFTPICFVYLLLGNVGLIAYFTVPVSGSRFEPGRCVKCGYDLRATPGRCPECGTPVERSGRDVFPRS